MVLIIVVSVELKLFDKKKLLLFMPLMEIYRDPDYNGKELLEPTIMGRVQKYMSILYSISF